MRVLKKYANRRLYDTQTSSYIKLEDVQQMIVQFQPVQVLDVATEEDITEQVLLSIIKSIENQKEHQKILTRTLLEQMIRMYSYDCSTSLPLSQYLENALRFYEQGVTQMSQPFDLWSKALSQPYDMWHKSFGSIVNSAQEGEADTESHEAKSEKGASVAKKKSSLQTTKKPASARQQPTKARATTKAKPAKSEKLVAKPVSKKNDKN